MIFFAEIGHFLDDNAYNREGEWFWVRGEARADLILRAPARPHEGGGHTVLALEALDKDRAFLKEGGVFTDDVIDAYIALKMQEVTKLRMSTHPVELELYYSV